MKIRYFYSPAIFFTQPKLFVLTEDRVLYSESRDLSVTQIDQVEVKSFVDFNPKEHESEDYPILLEISSTEAKEISETLRFDWIHRYLLNKGISIPKSLQAS